MRENWFQKAAGPDVASSASALANADAEAQPDEPVTADAPESASGANGSGAWVCERCAQVNSALVCVQKKYIIICLNLLFFILFYFIYLFIYFFFEFECVCVLKKNKL